MFTVCPKCTLTLAVTANDLRMGQGYVRCGRCANVFNALLTLSEEPADEGGGPGHARSPHEDAPHGAQSHNDASDGGTAHEGAAHEGSGHEHTTHDAEAGGGTEGMDSASSDTASLPLDPELSARTTAAQREDALEREEPAPAQHAHAERADGPSLHLATEKSSDGSIENESNFADGTGTFETIVLEGDAITQTEEYVPEESVDSEIAALTQRLGMAAHEPVATPLPEREQIEAADAIGAEAFGPPQSTDEAAARPRWPWIAGSVALLLLLALQAMHHWRDALATSPGWYALLSRSYAALGMPLEQHWDLAAYDVRQQGALADPSDSQIIRVRLSLANRAARAQPLPLLRLTLLDRYGKRVAASELTPAQYWPAGAAPPASLARDERVDSEVSVRDPGAASASFELDVCLRGSTGLRCASDTAASTAGAVVP